MTHLISTGEDRERVWYIYKVYWYSKSMWQNYAMSCHNMRDPTEDEGNPDIKILEEDLPRGPCW